MPDLLATLFPAGALGHAHLLVTILAMLLIWGWIMLVPLPGHLSLSAPLAHRTPLPVACIIPPPAPTIADLVYLSQTVGGRVKVIIWPEDALFVEDEGEAEQAIDWVHSAVWEQYGVWTLMSLIIGEKGEREKVLVGPSEWGASGSRPTQWDISLPP
jgi:hypothetical protein